MGSTGASNSELSLLGGRQQLLQLRPVGVERGEHGVLHVLGPDVVKGGQTGRRRAGGCFASGNA